MRPPRIALFFLVGLLCFSLSAQISNPDSLNNEPPPQTPATAEQEAFQNNVAPVIFKRDTLYFIRYSANEYPVTYRAKQISKRLNDLYEKYEKGIDTIYVKEGNQFASIMYNDEIAFIITENDAITNKMSLNELAEMQIRKFKESVNKQDQYNLSTKEWLIRIGYFLISLVILILVIKVINWLFRKLNIYLSRFEKRFLKNKKNIFKYFIPKNTANIFVFLSNVLRIITILFVLFTYLPFMFSFFPWAEEIVSNFYGYLARPVRFVFYGFVDFLPNLIFIIVIILITRYIIRVQKDIVEDIEAEKFIIKNFPKDWANTTQKIISLLIWAFALVLIYPHLPGSTSPAFKGVSIFIGALVSFGSTSAVANIVAGVVITYMRPYQIGDRVRIQDTVGDVIEKTLLVTRIRTVKNEDVTIPNANIIINHLVNYSANVDKNGLLLHTSITIGYDIPWKTVEKLLIDAGKRSLHIEAEPSPFVLQTSLDDNYVSYELNAYSKEPKKMALIYSDIHKNILEVFNEAGIEILSPSYIAARDGNLTTVPSKIPSDSRSPFDKLVDHLTGKNQAVTVRKSSDKKTKPDKGNDKGRDLFSE
ncbi:mechanosensitive ion channel domain-containing protein [Lutimonas zeaxanthinifaciens]|uniref:mechanosensitive ion channel domain-containing protein n=1 Tax=Lutimonas zeaxanthinifaciens TaxID=3060215 RepID=UPI00265D0812|nr:mechanosensitive ion channel domain-containing protein [Lutimonas sp. YSD2104]WKK66604.1 mechanosensitive ion channel [Lutimonas sp. YSD2104]